MGDRIGQIGYRSVNKIFMNTKIALIVFDKKLLYIKWILSTIFFVVIGNKVINMKSKLYQKKIEEFVKSINALFLKP